MQETLNVIERQEWLEPAEDTIQRGVYNALNANGEVGHDVNDFLNGTWLGHPLHPLIVAVPIGAWTVSFALDGVQMLTKTRKFEAGADAALTLGILGALGSAAAGLADWQYTVGRARRVGLVHALSNVTALALHVTSLLCRRNGSRKFGQLAGMLGYGALMLGGYLGGDLSYNERMGMNHAPEQQPPSNFVPVLAERELPEGTLRCVQAGDVSVVLARHQGHVYTLANSCSHLGGPLAEGQISGDCVVCPWHGSRFRLRDGKLEGGPSTYDQPSYETRVRDGLIEVRGKAQSPDA